MEEELDETAYWLEMITRSGMVDKRLLADLQAENDELLRIIVRSIITTKKKHEQQPGEKRWIIKARNRRIAETRNRGIEKSPKRK